MKTERRVSRRTASLRASEKIKTYFNPKLDKLPQENLLNPKLDPSLWSKVPHENLLDIFDALLVKDHYRLRRVCKQWYNRASERRRLLTQDRGRVREPFFVLIRKNIGEKCSPFGTLALQAASGQWMWQRSFAHILCHPIGHLRENFEVEGVVFQGLHILDFISTRHLNASNYPLGVLFDVHRNENMFMFEPSKRIQHVNTTPGSVLGMMVDDASRVYTLILGSCTADTLLLDSRTNVWQSKPSRLVRARPPSASTAPKSCVQLQGKMYLWIDSDEIHVYSPSSDQWSALAAPPRDVSNEDEFRGLGHWAGVLYAMTKNEQGTLSVWKLNMGDGQWSEYAQISRSLFAHLMQPGAVLPIVASHCNGYLLMHVLALPDFAPARDLDDLKTTSLDELLSAISQNKLKWCPRPMKLGRRFVLFNIANRRWEMVDMPYSKLWN